MGCENSKENVHSPLIDSKQHSTQNGVNFVAIGKPSSEQNLDQLELSFIYTKLYKEVVIDMKTNENVIKDFTIYCRQIYNKNKVELDLINEFERDYQSQKSIWWYTRPCFVFELFDQAVQILETKTLIKMGFFIRDLHHQIEQLHHQQIDSCRKRSFNVYQALHISTKNLENLLKTQGQFISFNNFLLTNKNPEVSLDFAKTALTKSNTIGVFFQISIDPSLKSTPFASIQEMSYSQTEGELLFSMHAIFRIETIQKIDNNNLLYQVQIKSIGNDDSQVITLVNCIQEERSHVNQWERLGRMLFKLSQFNKAEEFYKILLEQTSNEYETACYYNQLGYIKDNQGDYQKAISYYEQSVELWQKNVPISRQELANTYCNIGMVYCSLEDYSKAFVFNEKALEIRKEILVSDHPELATSYNNIGMIYEKLGEYSKALELFEKTLEICQKSPSSNHELLATSYSNIGLVYQSMGEYSKAFSFHQKALEIKEKNLPSNHPDLGISYNNIGLLYQNMSEYTKALASFEKALHVYQKTLPSDHSLLGNIYNNIGLTYQNMKDYSKSLVFHQKALEIQLKSLPSDHSSLATSYNNIAMVYYSTDDYFKALAFYQKASGILEKTLPSNHPNLASFYNNVAYVYVHIKDYSKALDYFQRTLEIRKHILPIDHPDMKTTEENIENCKKRL